MQVLTYDQLPKPLRRDVDLIQRLGVEADTLRPLVVDGVVGPRTRSARFLVAHGGGHPLVLGASAYVEQRAEEVGGNNRGKWVERFYGKHRPLGAWCAAFVSTVLREVYPDATYTLGARRSFDRAKATAPESVVQPGDLRGGDVLTWVRPSANTPYAGHIGIVAHVEDGIVYTIEGNAGPLGRVRVWAYRLPDPRRSATEAVWGAFRPDLVWGLDDNEDDEDAACCDGSEGGCEVCHAEGSNP